VCVHIHIYIYIYIYYITVLIVGLELDLEKPSLHTVQMTHKACLVIQHAAYMYRGTLRQFLQDDKGCLVWQY